MHNIPRVGVGVLIFNSKNQLLLGKRKSTHGLFTYGPPGGHLEFGESIEQCAIREAKEEVGLVLDNPEFIAITNDHFLESSKHYISIFLKARCKNEEKLVNLEPAKVEYWDWFSPEKLPNNLFLPLHNLSQGKYYGTIQDKTMNELFSINEKKTIEVIYST